VIDMTANKTPPRLTPSHLMAQEVRYLYVTNRMALTYSTVTDLARLRG
jgi:hypothetical protein